MREHSYSRRHRFAGMAAFAPVLRSGGRLRSPEAGLAFVPGTTPGISRFGIVLPRRMAPKATTRNRMKRVAREIFRQHAVRNHGLDLIVLPRAAFGRGKRFAWAGVVRGLLERVTAAQ